MTGGERDDPVGRCFRRLVQELGCEAGRAAVAVILAELGGGRHYVPTGMQVRLAARNNQIRAEFHGCNHQELAMRYQLTTQQIRNILKK